MCVCVCVCVCVDVRDKGLRPTLLFGGIVLHIEEVGEVVIHSGLCTIFCGIVRGSCR